MSNIIFYTLSVFFAPLVSSKLAQAFPRDSVACGREPSFVAETYSFRKECFGTHSAALGYFCANNGDKKDLDPDTVNSKQGIMKPLPSLMGHNARTALS